MSETDIGIMTTPVNILTISKKSKASRRVLNHHHFGDD
jgi:hypothetical protein